MKKQFTILFLVIFFIIPFYAHALTGQYPWDPLYIQPTQETKNNTTRQNLKNQYGVSAYYQCYPCTYQDTSDPYTETRCLQSTQYCLERQQIQKLQQCEDGYIFFNGRCVTIDASCKEQYGKFSYYRGQKDENGKYSCGCINGYDWNTNQSVCIEKKVTVSQCTSNSWSCENWSSCSSNGSQTRTCSKISNCEGGTQSPVTTQSCTYSSPSLPAVPNPKIDEKNIKATVKVMIWDKLTSSYIGWGTGVVIEPMTTIITNYHVLKDTINNPDRYLPVICATLAANILPDCSFVGSVFGMFNDDKNAHYNKDLDLALLSIAGKIDSEKNITSMWHIKVTDLLVFGNNISLSDYGYGTSINTKAGDNVQVFGYPADGGEMLSNFKGEVLEFLKNSDGRILKIVTSARITPGQSGGGAFDKNGKFLGITSAYYHENGKFLAGLIVPVTTVNLWIQEEQGYRINKKGEYTMLTENIEENISKAVCLLGPDADSNSHYDSNSEICVCDKGYSENNQGECEKIEQNNNIQNASPLTCKANSTKIDNACVCNDGYIMVGTDCISHTENCKKYYGQNVYGAKGNDNNSNCYCNSGYDWDSNRKNCIKQTSVIEEEKKSTGKLDKNLVNRLSGNILLQVEKNGEGWYVNPDNKKKYYLGRPADAFSIMRNLGLGIKHSELNGYLNSKFPSRLSGKIMLDVEQNGEAYYIYPKNLKGYFLSRPADAFKVMRDLGLGITNADIRKIGVGEIK